MNGLTFENVFEVLPTPYMVLDRTFAYVAVNRAYEATVGRSRDQLLGIALFEAFPSPDENGQRLRASLERVLSTGRSDTLAVIPYRIERSSSQGGGMEDRFWTATHTPLFGDTGEVEFIVQNTVEITELVRLQESASLPLKAGLGEISLLRNAKEREEAFQGAVSQAAEFRRMFMQAPGLIAVLQGPDHVFSFANEAYMRFVGGRPVIGLTVEKAVPEIRLQGFIELLDRVYTQGEPIAGEGIRVLLDRAGGGELEEAFMDFTYTPIRNVDGQVTGIFVQGADRTDSMRAGRRQRRLVDELNHRVKNTLATVQSIARQSFRNIRDPEEARYAFEARIQALSKTHNVLSERQWEAAGFTVLLAQELSPFDPDQVSAAGPEVSLNSKAAIALTMVFHELASNAARHGALSRPGGRLRVGWERRDGRLHVEWSEHFAERPPNLALGDGFGLRVMRRIVEGELDGKIALDVGPAGVICRFEVPIAGVEDIEGRSAFS